MSVVASDVSVYVCVCVFAFPNLESLSEKTFQYASTRAPGLFCSGLDSEWRRRRKM